MIEIDTWFEMLWGPLQQQHVAGTYLGLFAANGPEFGQRSLP